jgi:hypothetical protein
MLNRRVVTSPCRALGNLLIPMTKSLGDIESIRGGTWKLSTLKTQY